jgi:microcystin-dependent protein
MRERMQIISPSRERHANQCTEKKLSLAKKRKRELLQSAHVLAEAITSKRRHFELSIRTAEAAADEATEAKATEAELAAAEATEAEAAAAAADLRRVAAGAAGLTGAWQISDNCDLYGYE